MQLSILAACLYFTIFTSAFPSIPSSDLSVRSDDSSILNPWHAFEKRKGGGGGGGKGGGGGSSGGRSSGGSGSRTYSYQTTSNTGGRTRDGSGDKPVSGGKYAGGAAVPYTAGAKSPTRGVAPYAIGAGAIGFWGVPWAYGYAWGYPYPHAYYWGAGGRNHTANITCVCQQYQVCGCDPDNNSTFTNQLIGNGTDGPVNSTYVRVVTFDNGTSAAFINGSLANGTTASGGTDPSNDGQADAAVTIASKFVGYWVMISVVAATVWLS